MKQKLFFIFKIIISLTLLGYLLFQIDWGKFYDALINANYFWLAVTILITFFDMALLTYKWNLLLKIKGKFVCFSKLFTINMIGGFWGLFLPSSLGTDIVRGYYLIKSSSDKAISITSIFIDRFISIIALIVFVGIGLFFASDILEEFHLGYYVGGLLILSIVGVLFLLSDKFELFVKLLEERFKDNKIINNIIKLRVTFIEYSKYRTTLFLTFILSFFVQLIRVLWYITIALAFGVNIELIYYFILCPLIIIILMIPVSIGGLGVREGAFVALFTMVGMKMDDAIIISFTSSLLANLFTISGGFFYLISDFVHSIDKIKTSSIQINN